MNSNPLGTALVLGEALVDIVIDQAQTREIPGGSPANVALGLGRLGRQVRLATWLGQDQRGELIQEHLAKSNVVITPESFGAEHTSTARALLDEQGAATYEFDFTWEASPALLLDTDILVHTGSLGAFIEPGCQGVLDTLVAANDQATLSYDPNARPTLMGDAKTAAAKIMPFVEVADVVKLSDEDAAFFSNKDEMSLAQIDQLAEDWLGRGVELLVVTAGNAGSVAYTASGMRFAQSAPKGEVVDTVGAGDSFMGGLLDALWHMHLLGKTEGNKLAHMSERELQKAMEWAAKVAAVTVSRQGANPPTKAELVFS
ncbi:hypothetical protein BK816_03175 [Boudabousia tangfeifanii]|uniref:Carbohydrate kinase PfkB domain-containing protein n=1 Tax=Boudabousia tangfeifanii TaxID=1912795 RepID=A0A1D9MJF6_9ACTO|nr:carbohydrate kinase [Boudabousia tangfeifanii]AOZ72416.1 hypothetical protein BK816_03175 [Boudabousia tangfeifanii]